LDPAQLNLTVKSVQNLPWHLVTSAFDISETMQPMRKVTLKFRFQCLKCLYSVHSSVKNLAFNKRTHGADLP